MLPTLASANPLHTTPSAPTPIVALFPTPYPPRPGLPPLPDTNRPNVILDNSVAAPTVPVAPPRRTSRPHTVRGPSSFGYSAVTVPTTYSHKVRADENITTCTASQELTDLLSVATVAVFQNDDHLARSTVTLALATSDQLLQHTRNLIHSALDELEHGQTIHHLASANSAISLNVNPDGSPLTFRTAVHGAERESWKDAEDTEISRLLDTSTMHAIHLEQQPLDRRGDTTYYNPKPKEKYDDAMNKVYRIRGTAGGDRINYDGPTKANTAALSTVKILL